MFNNKKKFDKQIENQIDDLKQSHKQEILALQTEIEKLKKDFENEKYELKTNLHRSIEEITFNKDFEISKLQKKLEDNKSNIFQEKDHLQKVFDAKLIKETSELTIQKNKYEDQITIYREAFNNLGFDVKDMKDILNKLVDGIVSKNTSENKINIIR